jgi:hypothetical protein
MNLSINGSAEEVDDRHAKTPPLWVRSDVMESNPAPDATQIALWMNSNVVPKQYGANSWAAVKGYLDATAAMPPMCTPEFERR